MLRLQVNTLDTLKCRFGKFIKFLKSRKDTSLSKWYFKWIGLSGGFPTDATNFPKIKAKRTGYIWWWYKLSAWYFILEASHVFVKFGIGILTVEMTGLRTMSEAVWVFCGFMILNSIFCLHKKEDAIASLYEQWVRIDEDIDSSLSNRFSKKDNRRVLAILIFYIGMLAGSVMGLCIHFVYFPETSIYVYNLFNFEKDSKIKYLFISHEFLLMSVVWFKIFPIEIFMVVFAQKVLTMLRVIEYLMEENPKIAIEQYKKLQIIVFNFNLRLKNYINNFQVILISFITLITYTAVRSWMKFPGVVNLLFVGNSVGGMIRMFLLMTPMGIANEKSMHVIKCTRQISSPLLRREVETLREIKFKNGNFFFIDKFSALTFCTFIISQVNFLLQTY